MGEYGYYEKEVLERLNKIVEAQHDIAKAINAVAEQLSLFDEPQKNNGKGKGDPVVVTGIRAFH